MKVLLIGDGQRASELLAVMNAHPRTSVKARVARDAAPGDVPVYLTLEAALRAVAADAVVLAGEVDPPTAAAAAAGPLPILIANPARLTETAIQELQRATRGGTTRVMLARHTGYANCRETLAGYVGTGRLGAIGHVSIEDHRAGGDGAVDGVRHWMHRGGSLLAQSCELLGASAQDVMARIDDANQVTQAYVATSLGIHLHYSARWAAAIDSHCLWIEGTNGSLKVDGRAVWWRKRGWRFFVPIRLSGVADAISLSDSWARLVADAGQALSARDDGTAFDIAIAALLSSGRRQAVAVAPNRSRGGSNE